MNRVWPLVFSAVFFGVLLGPVVLPVCQTGGLSAQWKPGKPYKGIRFAPDYAAALEEAAGRGCPILVCVTNEQAYALSTRYLYDDKAIIKLSRGFACVVAHEHITHTSDYGKKVKKKHKSKRCPFYGTIMCKQHADAWAGINDRFLRHSVVQTLDIPQHIYVSPKNEELFRRRSHVSIRDMKYDMQRALKEVGAGLKFKQYEELKKTIAVAERGLGRGQIRPAAKQLGQFVKLRKKHRKVKSALFPKGDALIQKLETRGAAQIAKAREYAKNGQKARAIEVLEAVARDYPPFKVAEQARNAIRDVKTGK